MCRIRRFLVVLRSFFHSSLLRNFSCHPSPPTILQFPLSSSCHLLLGLPLNLVVPKFIYTTVLGIILSSILCTCPNQHNLFNFFFNVCHPDVFVLYRMSQEELPDFGRLFLKLKYTDITQNTYIQSWTVTEIMAREVCKYDSCYTLTDYQIHIKTGRNMWFL